LSGNGDTEALQKRIQQLSSLLEISRKLTSTLNLEEVLGRAFESVEVVLEAERSSVWRMDEERGTLSFLMARGEGIDLEELRDVQMKLGEGIVGHVAQTGEPLIVEEVHNDPRWSSKMDQRSGFTTHSILCVPLVVNERTVGVIQVLNRKDGGRFRRGDLNRLEMLAAQVAIALDNAILYEEKRRTFFVLAETLAEVIERRDTYTGGHVHRVVEYSIAAGVRMGLDEGEQEQLRLAAILHDIGKIGIQDKILNKEGKLTAKEEALMRQHVLIGAQILSGVPFLRQAVPGVLHHHERYDGDGYPEGLKGEAIPISARIIAVADTYDAMTTDRPYRGGMGPESALAELDRCSGTQFCPRTVAAFRAAYDADELKPNSEGEAIPH
jgi:HD-GYP domain-containing protein (c-di-GMP phosphodiesterase class II)